MEKQKERITGLFAAALQQDPSNRSEFLRQACAGDSSLFAEVQSLVAEYETTGDTVNSPHTPAPKSIDLTGILSGLDGPGTLIGPYQLLAQLGAGGMGVVYEAQQLRPIRRVVALKVLKPGMDSREVVTRFEGERQALALMSHPNIAQVYDAGATDSGRPYFVMERVEGVHITHYCASRRLGLRQRLELFIPVCHAIQHAHQKGIIHRDIKPSNLLVSEQDGKAVPKVIDFGIAKATGDRLTDATVATHLGAVIGTLDYMSPEQAGFGTHDIDTRSDIYSLGAVLYELIAGTPPFDFARSDDRNYLDALRRIREEEPPPPSVRCSGDEPRRAVRGELDWIVMKALEKDRARRYETANGLLRDLQRYLDGEPVEAGPPSATYRLRKVARKYRTWLAAGALFAALLVAATAVSAWLAVRASRARQESLAVISFLQNDLLKQASPNQQSDTGGRPDPDLKVRTLLDRAAAHVAGHFDRQPQVEASIRETIGSSYADLGVYQQAASQLERALELRRRALGRDHPDTLGTMDTLGWVYYKQAKFAPAQALLVDALQTGKRVLGPSNPLVLSLMDHLATVYHQHGKNQEGEALLREAIQTAKRVLGPQHPKTLAIMFDLAEGLSDNAHYKESEAILTPLVAGQRRVLGPEHPDTLNTMFILAGVYRAQGKYAAAGDLLTQVAGIQRRVLGPEHPNTLKTLNNLAIVYRAEGRYAEAEALYKQLLEVRRRVLGPAHPETLSTMNNLARVYDVEGNFAPAEALYLQVLERGKDVLRPGLKIIAETNLGAVLLSEGKYARAEAVVKQADETGKRLVGPEHPNILTTSSLLGMVYHGQGKDVQAKTLLAQVAETQRRVMGREHPDSLRTEQWLGEVYRDERQYQQAAEILSPVLEAQRRVLGISNPGTLHTLMDLAQTDLGEGKYSQAESLARQASAAYDTQPSEVWERSFCRSLLGAALSGEKKYAEAEPLLLKGYSGMLERKATIPAPALTNLAFAGDAIVQLYEARKERDRAASWRAKLKAAR